ncbi:MAG: hypothetical protein GVY10_08355 [Verrucomicrobia bacterium]|jgi:hypothetical protein|nr:hypothetical protein [Verrucomicrobiota bacterium]
MIGLPAFPFPPRPCRLSADGRFFVAWIFLLCLCFSASLQAQFKFREPPNRQDPASLPQGQGEAIWEAFQANRALGSFVLEGRLTYRPPRDPSRHYGLRLEGDWSQTVRTTAIRLRAPKGNVTTTRVRLEFTPEGKVVRRRGEDGEWKTATDSDLEEPLLPGLPLSIDDLLLTFLDWGNPRYKGPDRFLGRPAHVFVLRNPAGDDSPQRVEVWLDEDYAAILRIDVFTTPEARTARVRVGGFREFSSGWMFSSLVWENRRTRESIRLEVDGFSLQP